MQPEIRSFVSVLRSPVTPFDRSKTKNANCSEERNVLATESVNSAPFSKREEINVQIFGKEKCKTLRHYLGEIFGEERCKIHRQFQRY